jgi:phytanoyl-CoA hydroxylase
MGTKIGLRMELDEVRMTHHPYTTLDNLGRKIEVPAVPEDDLSYFTSDESASFLPFYRENGFVVIRGAVAREICDRANEAFNAEVYRSPRFIYRQTTARAERNVFSKSGLVVNPILNVQSVDPNWYPNFRAVSVDVLTSPAVRKVCATLFGQPGKIVQSMYFHGNPATWPHQDTYYLDASNLGQMTAAWIATEDIQPGAGRFFVCPGSHKIDMARNGGDFDIAYNHDRYKKLVENIIESHQLQFVAPALRKGDVLFWAAGTIHGSLPTSQPNFSRRSFTSHWIPQSTELMQFQTRVRPLPYETVNGVQIARPKDLAQLHNRAILSLEATFPRAFYALKNAAIKIMVR